MVVGVVDANCNLSHDDRRDLLFACFNDPHHPVPRSVWARSARDCRFYAFEIEWSTPQAEDNEQNQHASVEIMLYHQNDTDAHLCIQAGTRA